MFCFKAFPRASKVKTNADSIPAKLVAKLYDIYKTQKFRNALKITTGSMKKRFKKLYNYMRMHQYRVPARLKRLSAMLHDYKFIGQYDHKYKGRKYSLIDCIWVMKYRDSSKYSSGITKTKVVVRSYLVKKVRGNWKVSSEKFVTEYILRGAEIKYNKMIKKSIQRQRLRRRRRRRYRGRGAGRYGRRRYYRRNG